MKQGKHAQVVKQKKARNLKYKKQQNTKLPDFSIQILLNSMRMRFYLKKQKSLSDLDYEITSQFLTSFILAFADLYQSQLRNKEKVSLDFQRVLVYTLGLNLRMHWKFLAIASKNYLSLQKFLKRELNSYSEANIMCVNEVTEEDSLKNFSEALAMKWYLECAHKDDQYLRENTSLIQALAVKLIKDKQVDFAVLDSLFITAPTEKTNVPDLSTDAKWIKEEEFAKTQIDNFADKITPNNAKDLIMAAHKIMYIKYGQTHETWNNTDFLNAMVKDIFEVWQPKLNPLEGVFGELVRYLRYLIDNDYLTMNLTEFDSYAVEFDSAALNVYLATK